MVSPELLWVNGVELKSVVLLEQETFSPVAAVLKSYICSQLAGISVELCWQY